MGKKGTASGRDGKSSTARSKAARAVTDALADARAAKRRSAAPPIEESDEEDGGGSGANPNGDRNGGSDGEYDNEDEFGHEKTFEDDDEDTLGGGGGANGPSGSGQDSEDELAQTRRQLAKVTKSNLELRDALLKIVPGLFGTTDKSTSRPQTSNQATVAIAIPSNRSTMCVDQLQKDMGILGNEQRWLETRTNARDITAKAGFDLDLPWGSQDISKKTDAAFALRQAIPEFERFINNWGAQHLIQETFNHRRNRILSLIAQEKKAAKKRAQGVSNPPSDPGPKVDKRKRAYRKAHGDEREKSGKKSGKSADKSTDKPAEPAEGSRSFSHSRSPSHSPPAPSSAPLSEAPLQPRARTGIAPSGSAPDPPLSAAERRETRASKAAKGQFDPEDPPPPTTTSNKRKHGGSTKGNTPAKKAKAKA